MTETTTLPIAIPHGVLKFCEVRGIVADLYSAFRIAEEAYAPASNWNIAVEPDPEIEDEEYVIIDVTTTGDVEELLRKHRAFVDRWTCVANRDAIGQIRVLWNVV